MTECNPIVPYGFTILFCLSNNVKLILTDSLHVNKVLTQSHHYDEHHVEDVSTEQSIHLQIKTLGLNIIGENVLKVNL